MKKIAPASDLLKPEDFLAMVLKELDGRMKLFRQLERGSFHWNKLSGESIIGQIVAE